MRSSRIGLAVATGVLAVIGLAACGQAPTGSAPAGASDSVQVSETLSADGLALAAIGFDPMDLDTEDAAEQSGTAGSDLTVDPMADGEPTGAPTSAAAADPSARPGAGPRHRTLRRVALRRKNVLHGEFAVHTKQGDRTVAVQRGTVVSVTTTAITVRSTDGFTQTWRLDQQLRVVKQHARTDIGAVSTGATIGIAGVRDGDGHLGRLILVPAK